MNLETMNEEHPLSKDAKIEILGQALNDINTIIYARGAPLDSQNYFAIRVECVDTLSVCGIAVQ